jgi:hypothetical protein
LKLEKRLHLCGGSFSLYAYTCHSEGIFARNRNADCYDGGDADGSLRSPFFFHAEYAEKQRTQRGSGCTRGNADCYDCDDGLKFVPQGGMRLSASVIRHLSSVI